MPGQKIVGVFDRSLQATKYMISFNIYDHLYQKKCKMILNDEMINELFLETKINNICWVLSCTSATEYAWNEWEKW